MPDPAAIERIREPYIRATIISPASDVGPIMELRQARRGTHVDLHYLSPERVQLRYDLPLAEIVLDFFDQLKSRTAGYVLLDYEPLDNRDSDLVKLDVLLAGDRVDALCADRPLATTRTGRTGAGRATAEDDPAPALRRPGQAAVGSRVLARETVKALRRTSRRSSTAAT